MLVTFFACLFAGVELGILVGVAVDIAIMTYLNSRPKIYIEYRNVRNFSVLIEEFFEIMHHNEMVHLNSFQMCYRYEEGTAGVPVLHFVRIEICRFYMI